MSTPLADSCRSVLAEPGADYHSIASLGQWVEVLVDCPGAQGLFTYRLGAGFSVQPGDILSVPFGASRSEELPFAAWLILRQI